MSGPKRLAVLASGRGSNFAAIADGVTSGKIPNAKIVGLVVNKSNAGALELAKERDIPHHVVASKDYRREGRFDREAHESAVRDVLLSLEPDLICLAGYMLIIGRPLLEKWPSHILNIHPSLLPKYRGLHAQKQALEANESETGCTVHFVNEELDAGPIVKQATVPILPDDTEESVSERLLPVEHRTYLEALADLCQRPYRFENNAIVWD